MANVLYLVHRLPYPPNKGDKVRSYNLLRHLQRSHRVFLGTFVDTPEDIAHVPELRAICPDLHVESIDARWGKLKSLKAIGTGKALSVAFYESARLHDWIAEVQSSHDIDATVVFSGAMAQFALPLLPKPPMLVDFVDVDSTKWSQYAPAHRWPLSWLYRREGQRLLTYERAVAAQAKQSFFVTPAEAALFKQAAPEVADRVGTLCNGVDADFFSQQSDAESPFKPTQVPVVFTGAMDYWPNIDGVTWFVEQVLPALRARCPNVHFYIVGRNPSAQVKALACEAVSVTGTVHDVRPYLQHAKVVVAPLRVARGIQNKILEAMAMSQPVVTVPGCANAIGADASQGLFHAASAAEFVGAVDQLINAPELSTQAGHAARQFVVQNFSWQAHLSALDAWLNAEANPS